MLTTLLISQSGFCADKIKLFADSPCKGAYEYHFLNRAAYFDDLIGVELLLKSGADVNGKGYAKYPDCVAGIEFTSPLMSAVWGKNINIVRTLLDKGADPNLLEGEGVSPTQMARKDNLKEILDLLIQHGGK